MEGRGAGQCAWDDRVGLGGDEVDQNNRMWCDQPSLPPSTSPHTPTTAVSPAGSQFREGREIVERAGLDARYRVAGEAPRGKERGATGKERSQKRHRALRKVRARRPLGLLPGEGCGADQRAWDDMVRGGRGGRGERGRAEQ